MSRRSIAYVFSSETRFSCPEIVTLEAGARAIAIDEGGGLLGGASTADLQPLQSSSLAFSAPNMAMTHQIALNSLTAALLSSATDSPSSADL